MKYRRGDFIRHKRTGRLGIVTGLALGDRRYVHVTVVLGDKPPRCVDFRAWRRGMCTLVFSAN